jgi:FO synthase
MALFAATGDQVAEVAAVADALRRDRVGDEVTYVVNRNLNFTNVCYTGCRFCAFAQRESDADAFTLSPEEIASRVQEAWDAGATEICMQGGIHPRTAGQRLLRPRQRPSSRPSPRSTCTPSAPWRSSTVRPAVT